MERTKVNIESEVGKVSQSIMKQAVGRGKRVTNALRNAELNVLRGQRSGKLYKKPNSKVRYRASAPGEAPARRTGNLRLHWDEKVEKKVYRKSVKISSYIKSKHNYSGYLDEGTGRMAARPFKNKVYDMAEPKARQIMNEPYRR